MGAKDSPISLPNFQFRYLPKIHFSQLTYQSEQRIPKIKNLKKKLVEQSYEVEEHKMQAHCHCRSIQSSKLASITIYFEAIIIGDASAEIPNTKTTLSNENAMPYTKKVVIPMYLVNTSIFVRQIITTLQKQ